MLLTTPLWQLFPLIEYLPALDARQLRRAATAAFVSHIKDGDRREFFYQLDIQAQRLYPRLIPPEPAPKLSYDREKAREWFAAQGINAVVVEQVESV